MSKASNAPEIMEALQDLGDVSSKNMFGGVGFFLEGVMFAKLSGDDTLYFRVDDTNRGDYEQLESEQFHSSRKKKSMPYYRVPAPIIADKSMLRDWARKAHAVAVANNK